MQRASEVLSFAVLILVMPQNSSLSLMVAY